MASASPRSHPGLPNPNHHVSKVPRSPASPSLPRPEGCGLGVSLAWSSVPALRRVQPETHSGCDEGLWLWAPTQLSSQFCKRVPG